MNKAVKLKITSEDLDRSEIWEYINSNWIITEKANATIEIEEIVAKKRAGYYSWDPPFGIAPKQEIGGEQLLDACRNDWFIDNNIVKRNKLFICMVDYTLSEQDLNKLVQQLM